jgi:hypothetical protein
VPTAERFSSERAQAPEEEKIAFFEPHNGKNAAGSINSQIR